MQASLRVKNIYADNINNISESIKKGEKFKVVLFNNPDIDIDTICIHILSTDESKDCTIMLDLDITEASFLASSLHTIIKLS